MTAVPEMTLRRCCAVLAAVLGIAVLVAPSGAAASAAVPAAPPKVTFGIGPADSKGLDGRSVLNYVASPGSRVTDHIAVVNYAKKPVVVRVYTADMENGANGALAYQPGSAPRRLAGAWISLAGIGRAGTITLAPLTRQVITIAVSVPTNANPGDHAAGVIASVTSSVVSKTGERVKFEQRVALRTYFRISGPLKPELKVEALHAKYHGTLSLLGPGTVTITYRVHNTGNIILSGTQAVQISGIFGKTGSKLALPPLPTLFPDATFEMRVDIAHVSPQLPMRATVRIVPLALRVAGAADPGLHTYTHAVTFAAIPWTLFGLILLILAAGGGYVWWRRNFVYEDMLVDEPPASAGRTPAGVR